MTTFYGSYEHSLDERGRVAIPARYRRAFVTGAVLRASPDGCIEMYTMDGFEAEVELRLGERRSTRRLDGRRIRRGFLPDAFEVELDRQGRVLLPPPLRTQSDMSERAVIIGCGDYIEIWDPDRWTVEQTVVQAEHSELEAAGDAAGGGS